MFLDEIDRRLLDDYQRDFPLTPAPYATLGQNLGLAEEEVRARLARLHASGAISRVGAVIRPHAVGFSTLAAMEIPAERLEEVAALVSSRPEVNHNYQREHALNLWFVVAAGTQADVARVLQEIAQATALEVLDLPMLEDFHIDLGFGLQWT